MTAAQTPPPAAGPDYLVAGRYRLASRLGGGGMGTVWLARDELLGRDVALKQIAQTAGLDAEHAESLRTRALHEGRILSRLTGPHVTGVFDVTLDKGAPWIVLEYLPSCSLAQVLHMTGTLPAEQVAQIGAQVADAMVEVHAAGILHRDIKPGNILIADRGSAAGVVKVSDFGIARSRSAAAEDIPEGDAEAGVQEDVQADVHGSAQAGVQRAAAAEDRDAGAGPAAAEHDPAGVGPDVIVGTPAFFAPEIARGHEPTMASDVFSLGSSLYTAIEGLPPFGVERDHAAMLAAVARGEVTAPLSDHPAMGMVLAMLEPDPSRRPGMAEVRDSLAAIAAGDSLDPQVVLDSPLLSPDGLIPVWVRKAGGIRQRSRAVPGSTVGGLIAVPHATPLSQVRHLDAATSAADWRIAPRAEPAPVHADASSRVPRRSSPPRVPARVLLRRLAAVLAVVVLLAAVLTLLVLVVF